MRPGKQTLYDWCIENGRQDILNQWHPTKNGDLEPIDVAACSGKKAWWYLPYNDPQTGKHFDFEWETVIQNRTKGTGCPYLTGYKAWPGFNDLATTHPQFAAEWHPTKNGSLTPSDVMAYSDKNIWWFLPYDDPITGKHFDFEWQANVANRVHRNQGCPFLSGKRVWAGFNDIQTTHPDVAKQWHPTKNGEVTPSNISAGSMYEAWWLLPYDDPITGKHFDFEWQSAVDNRTNKKVGCPFLSNPAKAVWPGFNDLATHYPELCKEWDYEKNSIQPSEILPGSNKRVCWKLEYLDQTTGKMHIFEWQDTVKARAYDNYGCPYLTNHQIKSDFNSVSALCPEVLKEWDYEKNEKIGLYPDKVSPNSGRKAWWKTPYDDPVTGKHFIFEWECVIYNKVVLKVSCPYLINQQVHPEFNSLAVKNPDLAKEWHPTKNGKLKPTDVTVATTQKVWWQIEVDGKVYEWKASISHRNSGQTHPALSQSHLEKAVADICDKLKIPYKRERGIKGCISDKNKMLRFDFILPAHNIIIECDGRQHFEPIDIFRGTQGFDTLVSHDNIKNQYCKDNNIHILRIPYIYDTTVSLKAQIKPLIINFIQTKQVPSEILDFYRQFDVSQYGK